MEQERSLFISYASEDRGRVDPIVDHLRNRGLSAWMDHREIKAGQDWNIEIRRALDRADVIVLFISTNSVDKRGYVQREAKLVLAKMEEKLPGDIYIIPVLLDKDQEAPREFSHIQHVKAWEDDAEATIETSISHQFDVLGAAKMTVQEETGVSWRRTRRKEEWDGLPGYIAEATLLHFDSDEYPDVRDISAVINGKLTESMMNQRQVKFDQTTMGMNFGQSKFRRSNTYQAYTSGPVITERWMSVLYTISVYGAGAAHPNYWFEVFNFLIDPVLSIESIKDIFGEEDHSFAILQAEVREKLLAIQLGEEGEDFRLVDTDVTDGTKSWDDFEDFSFSRDGLEIHFAPYHVGPYAFGSHSAQIGFRKFAHLLKPEFAAALGVEHMSDGDPPWAEQPQS